MTNNEQRAEFEAWYRTEFSEDISDSTFIYYESCNRYQRPYVDRMWAAYQAGRAALQSQEPKDNDLMLSAVLRMPFEMAMADTISRTQFYQRAQQALNELEALQSQDRDDVQEIAATLATVLHFIPRNDEPELYADVERLCGKFGDHARRIEGE